ncbi:tubulointerstitial nephritis antigen-like [Aphidius gifuensis]|uniref:tubulointerstitial nephritis antigen-like n=1 Tax=Aphidius gifuensis TaxID=684658 RepID=UPI001CDD2A96|nr:tubulointerstitial nephritis antigen-like [Aphidius gifuensis]
MCVKKEGKNAEITCEENDCLENLKKKNVHSVGTKDPVEWLSSVQEPLLVTDYGIPPPEEFDPRFDETRIVSPIRNQGQCGSSWAVSVADVISDRLSLQMNSNITLSAQQFIDCIDEEPQCAPGNPADAWNYATIAKLMSEERYPWTGLNDQCQVSTRQCQDENCHLNKLYSVNNVVHLSSHHVDLMYEILFKGSVQATMRVGKDFTLYNSGIYKCPKNSSSIGYHSVRIVGWSETDDGEQFWIAANSWGTEWGENGYFKIAKGINECDIESYVLAANVRKIQTDEIETPIAEFDKTFDNNKNNITNNYCSQLFDYKNCCDGLDGNCSVQYENKFCYCDNMCSNEPGHPFECCPDYKTHCERDDALTNPSVIIPQSSEDNVPSVLTKIRLMETQPFIKFMEFKSQVDDKNLPEEYIIPEKYLPQITGKWADESWAVTAVDVVSNRLSMKHLLDQPVVISAQQLVSCSKIFRLTEGQPKDAWIFMEQHNMVDDDCYPWTGDSNKCEFYIKENYLVRCQQSSILQRPKLYQIGRAYRVPDNENDIMNEIINFGSVQATMQVYQDFMNYKNGIYNQPKDAEFIGFLSVTIIGWGEESNEKFWIAANSWGTSWGENGYFKIARGINACGIENYVIGVEV